MVGAPGVKTNYGVAVASDDVGTERRILASLSQLRVRPISLALSSITQSGVSSHAVLAILAPNRDTESGTLKLVSELRRQDLALEILLLVPPQSLLVHSLARFGRAGVDNWLLAELPGWDKHLRETTRHLLAHHLNTTIVRQLLPSDVELIARSWCIRNGSKGMSASHAAHHCGVHRTTLNRRLMETTRRNASWHIALGRFAHVAHELDRSERPCSAISRSLCFPSATALSMFVRRFSGLSCTECRRRGALSVAFETAHDSR